MSTPRTDQEQARDWPMQQGAVSADFARTLERELTSAQAALTAAKAEIAALRAVLAKCTPLNIEERAYLGTLRDRETAYQATIDALRAEVEKLKKLCPAKLGSHEPR